jgi:hypothetical protein
MDRFNNFAVTPVTRSRIAAALYRSPAAKWKGSRAAVAMTFVLSAQPTLEGHRIEWTAVIRGERFRGTSSTVADAADQIERKVIEKNASTRPTIR